MLVPDRARRRALRQLEPAVAEPGDRVPGRPPVRVIGQERGFGVSEVRCLRDLAPAQVDAAVDGRGDRFDGAARVLSAARAPAEERAARQKQSAADPGPVQYYGPGRDEAVHQAYRAAHVGAA